MAKKVGPRLKYQRPDGCMSPNECGKVLQITGEAVKQWIYTGKLRAAKGGNGYWWIKNEDLVAMIEARKKGTGLEFKLHAVAKAK